MLRASSIPPLGGAEMMQSVLYHSFVPKRFVVSVFHWFQSTMIRRARSVPFGHVRHPQRQPPRAASSPSKSSQLRSLRSSPRGGRARGGLAMGANMMMPLPTAVGLYHTISSTSRQPAGLRSKDLPRATPENRNRTRGARGGVRTTALIMSLAGGRRC